MVFLFNHFTDLLVVLRFISNVYSITSKVVLKGTTHRLVKDFSFVIAGESVPESPIEPKLLQITHLCRKHTGKR